MKLGTIDLGSNSFRLLLGQKIHDEWHNEDKRLWTTRLGQRDKSGYITQEAFEKGLDALKHIYKECQNYGVDAIVGIATSAIRESQNGAEFVEAAKRVCPMDLRVIDGNEEARLGFIGATADVIGDGNHYAVLDVGGGSTEVSLGSKDGVYWTASYQVGAVRMKAISDQGPQHIWEETVRLWDQFPLSGSFGGCIAVGGTATSLGAIHQKMATYDTKKIQGYRLSREAIEGMILELRYMSDEERSCVLGLQAERADIIVAGAEIITSFMDTHELGSIVLSDKDGMEGAELEYGAYSKED